MRKMKDSKIAWVGEIPSHWIIHPIYYYFLEHKHKNSLGLEQNLLSLSYGKIIRKDISTNEGLLPENFNSYNVVEKDDIVLRLTDLQNDKRSLRTGLVKERGIITSAYVTLRATKELNSTYFHYLLHAYDVLKVLYNMGSGVRQGLNYEELSKLMLIEPPLDEQKKIAEYLDAKCFEIDALVADIQAQIETLEQYKRSTIAEAVTKGINHKVQTKDSGAGWLGEIPSHWNVDKLKYRLKRFEPRNPGNMIVLSLYRELGIIPKDSRDDNHNQTSEDISKYKHVKPGNFVVNKMKAWQGSVAVSDYEGIISPAYYVYKFTDTSFDKRYFHYLLRGCYKDEFMRLSGGMRVGQWDLSAEDLENTTIIIPPIEEQIAISKYLDEKCTEVDACVETKKEQIATLEAYKKSIIFEYVTGKKEVV